MPETIYAKYTDYRSSRFRLLTRFLMDKDGKLTVTKESAEGANAKVHLRSIEQAHDILAGLYGDTLRICPCTLQSGRLSFPFIEGTSFQTTLDEAVSSLDPFRIGSAFMNYASLLEGDTTNTVPFEYTPEFEAIFGKIPSLDGVRALAVSNLDCSGSNMIMDDAGALTIVDYEWVFSFPVPRDFVIYRNLRVMHQAHWSHIIRLETLLDVCSVHLDRDTLEAMDAAFNAYICEEPDGTPSRARLLKERSLKFTPHSEVFRRTDHFVFLDTGRGYNEAEKLVVPARSDQLSCTIDVAGARAIRFDPYGGARCMLRGLRCKTDKGQELTVTPAFAEVQGDVIQCMNPANLHIELPKGTRSVEIRGQACLLEDEADADAGQTAALAGGQTRIGQLAEELAAREREVEALRESLTAAQEEAAREHAAFEEAAAQTQTLQTTLDNIQNSKSWRYTEWMRRLRAAVPSKNR